MKTALKLFAILPCAALPLLVTGCGLFASSEETGVANVDAMQTAIEKVHVECELAQRKTRDASDLMNALVTGNYQGDAAEVYIRFVRALEESEEQAEVLREAVDGMKESAKPVFEQWQADLLKIANPTLRRRSEERLEETMDRFQDLVTSARASETGFDAFNQGARDVTLFLGNDFNPAAVSAVAPEARKVEDLAIEVDERLLDTQAVVREYMQSSGLPMPGETGGPEGGSLAAPAPGGAAPRGDDDGFGPSTPAPRR